MGSMIGQNVAVTASGNSTLIGRSGTVIDESKNMLTLSNQQGTCTIIKQSVTLQCAGSPINGKELVGTAAERLKRY